MSYQSHNHFSHPYVSAGQVVISTMAPLPCSGCTAALQGRYAYIFASAGHKLPPTVGRNEVTESLYTLAGEREGERCFCDLVWSAKLKLA